MRVCCDDMRDLIANGWVSTWKTINYISVILSRQRWFVGTSACDDSCLNEGLAGYEVNYGDIIGRKMDGFNRGDYIKDDFEFVFDTNTKMFVGKFIYLNPGVKPEDEQEAPMDPNYVVYIKPTSKISTDIIYKCNNNVSTVQVHGEYLHAF